MFSFFITWFCFISQHNAELNVQISTLSYSERELMDANGRLRESLERVREELRTTRTQMEKAQQEAERYVTEQGQFGHGHPQVFRVI